MRRHAPNFGLGVALIACYQYSQYWFDTRLSKAITAAVGGQSEVARELGLLLMGVALSAFGLRAWSRIAVFNAGRLAEYELRKELLAHLQRLGPAFYGKNSTGDIMSRVTNDLGQVRMMFGFGVLTAANTVLAFSSALAVTLQISVKLTVASLSTLPVLYLVMSRFARAMFSKQIENQESLGRMGTAVQSSIAGVRVVRSFALENDELRRFDIANLSYLNASLALARLRGMMFPIMQALTSAGLIVVLIYGGDLMLEKQITTGDFLAFYRALNRLTWPLISLGFLVSIVQRGRASYARLSEIFNTVPDIVDGKLPRLTAPGKSLRVDHLSYAYGEHRVLDDVSFELKPGESIAVVGRTGSGKSTLAMLLPRLLRTPTGTVFLDGMDVCDLPLRSVRNSIGYAQQSAFLFSTTIGRNIAYTLESPDSDEAQASVLGAAQEAQIADEIVGLRDGFDTVVGERGVQLSGGQKQRTALARGLVAQCSILILDDPLSAVDARTEKAILDAIDRQRARRSIVLITHRVAAAARCDRVLVLDHGRIVEQGTHDQLVAKRGLYALFAEEQRIENELAKLATEAVPEAAEAGA